MIRIGLMQRIDPSMTRIDIFDRLNHPSRVAGLCILFCICVSNASAEEPSKYVIAHYMTGMVPRTDRPLNRWLDPELAAPDGSTKSVGGLHQTVPMAPLHLENASLEDAVEFEIRAAQRMGVDGFQFYYPLVDLTPRLSKEYNQTIREFIRQSESEFKGFKISLCFAHPGTAKPTTTQQKIDFWAPCVRDLVDETKHSKAWLRTRDGSLLFFLWVGDALADDVQHTAKTQKQIASVANAYRQFSAAIGTPIEYVYHIQRPGSRDYVDAITENFHAVWGWTNSEEDQDFWNMVAARCKASNRMYTQTVYPDYYTSKVYARDVKGYTILPTDRALDLGTAGIERHYRVTRLADTQLDLLRRAMDRDAQIINYATWNDYPEGHHLAPEMNHNFGPAVLLRHFAREWKHGTADVTHDQAVVFFKRYRHDVVPVHSIDLNIKSRNKNQKSEDEIQLVVILKESAECFINDKSVGVASKGLSVHRIASEPGKVRVRVVRNDKPVVAFESPIAITNAPQRTNRLTYSYSSEHTREMKYLFGR